ncbi:MULTISPECIES: hypothetical protein [Terrabacteria group]|uniref:hypothetical protein n=1 Tax=Bacillati TaxID=1783272 RepID=UPI00193A44DC|nr:MULTISPECIES: hypothetical protein [Terrabacteria group]MBW9213108.1 hypothetical protein [Trueperella sp. zg.1013]QRG86931.1 hypothetical protein JOS54_01030 [Bulleidia sp. zg-1006]
MIHKKTRLLLEYLIEIKPWLEIYRKGLEKFIYLEIQEQKIESKTFEGLSDHFLLDFCYEPEENDRLMIGGLYLKDKVFIFQKRNQEIMYRLE